MEYENLWYVYKYKKVVEVSMCQIKQDNKLWTTLHDEMTYYLQCWTSAALTRYVL
jgi:hypothetical protein